MLHMPWPSADRPVRSAPPHTPAPCSLASHLHADKRGRPRSGVLATHPRQRTHGQEVCMKKINKILWYTLESKQTHNILLTFTLHTWVTHTRVTRLVNPGLVRGRFCSLNKEHGGVKRHTASISRHQPCPNLVLQLNAPQQWYWNFSSGRVH